jgi:GT2 family glycosyltransferase
MAMGLKKKEDKLPSVLIVIPSYNCKKILFRLLDSLKKTTYPDIKVIVVDNGSKDRTLEEGRKRYHWVKWIDAGEENIGQTGTYNLGFARANPKSHIIMIDSDVVVEPDMVSNLVARAESSEKIGIVTPMILYLSDKNWVNQAGANVNLWTGKVDVGWGPKKNFLQAKKVQNSGTVMLFKRQVLDKIGGFDGWFLCYFDPDYCLRAKKAGFETWYEPKAVCWHDQSKDPDVWRPRVLSRAYLLGRNRTLFMRRHGKSIVVYILFLPFLFGYYLAESIRFGIFPKWLELIKGTLVGFFYPLKKGNKIPLPHINK